MPLVALCYGTRPQVIKASVLRRALARIARVRAIDTGQHYDYELNALLYEQLEVTAPDAFLDVGSGSHASQLAAVLTGAATCFQRERPEVVVVIGDTNSTLGCALAAVHLRIPVVHVEAGLRAADALMAEEINRRAVDAVAHLLCAPSRYAAARLSRERTDGTIVETGDVARDVLEAQLTKLDEVAANGRMPAITRSPFLFATLHRAELTSDPARLRRVFDALAELALPVLLPAHPRTRQAVENASIRVPADRVMLVPPLGYLETLVGVRAAAAVVTDSGGVQREAYWLGTPCVTVRTETEWGETLAEGANRLSSPEALEKLGEAVNAATAAPRTWDRDAYGDGRAAERVASAVERLLAGERLDAAGGTR